LYARFSQAIALMPALNGYGTLDDTTDTAAETFITSGLAKVLKINNICDHEHITDCGFASKFTPFHAMRSQTVSVMNTPLTLGTLNNTFVASSASESFLNPYSQTDTNVAAFETANGESILAYYNPNCRAYVEQSAAYQIQPYICANFIYDLNGTKGPNTVGKDIGVMTALYSSDSVVVAPMIVQQSLTGSKTFAAAGPYCKSLDSSSRLAGLEEMASIYVNKSLFGVDGSINTFSNKRVVATPPSVHAWGIRFGDGQTYIYTNLATATHAVLCVH
ncbi:MAG: hypothetical protein NC390_08370, partial [Fusobacterium sp.]|nr:hypothetical protein [Fusobacterium sp.]